MDACLRLHCSIAGILYRCRNQVCALQCTAISNAGAAARVGGSAECFSRIRTVQDAQRNRRIGQRHIAGIFHLDRKCVLGSHCMRRAVTDQLNRTSRIFRTGVPMDRHCKD